MIKPASSLLVKILCWFFLNLLLLVAALAMFFAFQPQVNLHAVFGQEGSNHLRTTGMLISHVLHQTPRANWSKELASHAAIQKVDFILVLEDGSRIASKDIDLPIEVKKRVRDDLKRKGPPPPGFDNPQRPPQIHGFDGVHDLPERKQIEKNPLNHPDGHGKKPYLIMRTRHPTRYWAGIRIPVPSESLRPPVPGMLLAVSDSITGNGFFFDPLPWMTVAAVIMLISALMWIPMVRHITRPISRMTFAAEEVANGNFEVSIHESRTDEVGRLAKAINHMTARLSAFVKGQKRFLGDVAHELGSPIARIQFGLGALEHRTGKENRQRVIEVMEDVDHLSNLVTELLAFSRADMKSKNIKLKRIDLLPVIQSAVKREASSTVNIITNIEPDICIFASPELLTRAIANLVRNAVKYAGDSGPIYITAKKRANEAVIEIRDNGSGVPENFLDQLFEPFFRPEVSRDRESGGVGLGLAIVKTCVETCKGNVSASNIEPKGFAVTITLNT